MRITGPLTLISGQLRIEPPALLTAMTAIRGVDGDLCTPSRRGASAETSPSGRARANVTIQYGARVGLLQNQVPQCETTSLFRDGNVDPETGVIGTTGPKISAQALARGRLTNAPVCASHLHWEYMAVFFGARGIPSRLRQLDRAPWSWTGDDLQSRADAPGGRCLDHGAVTPGERISAFARPIGCGGLAFNHLVPAAVPFRTLLVDGVPVQRDGILHVAVELGEFGFRLGGRSLRLGV